jgi:hypothetical protein
MFFEERDMKNVLLVNWQIGSPAYKICNSEYQKLVLADKKMDLSIIESLLNHQVVITRKYDTKPQEPRKGVMFVMFEHDPACLACSNKKEEERKKEERLRQEKETLENYKKRFPNLYAKDGYKAHGWKDKDIVEVTTKRGVKYRIIDGKIIRDPDRIWRRVVRKVFENIKEKRFQTFSDIQGCLEHPFFGTVTYGYDGQDFKELYKGDYSVHNTIFVSCKNKKTSYYIYQEHLDK